MFAMRSVMIFAALLASVCCTAVADDQSASHDTTTFTTTTTTEEPLNTTGLGLTAGLVEVLVHMVKKSGGLPPSAQGGVLTHLRKQIDDKEFPALRADLMKDQNLLNYHAKVLRDCDSGLIARSSLVSSLGATSSSLLRESKKCDSRREALLKEKYSASANFAGWMNSRNPPNSTVPSVPLSTTGMDFDDLEEWLAGALNFYTDYNKTYTEFKINETKVDVEAKLEVVECSGQARTYQQAYCAWKSEIATVTESYASCRNETSALYQKSLARFKLAESVRISKLRALFKARCQLSALEDLDTGRPGGLLDACENIDSSSSSGGGPSLDSMITGITLQEPSLAPRNEAALRSLGTPSANVTCS